VDETPTVDNIAPVALHAYAHDAVVVMQPGGDPNAPGGAITKMLCGSWDHPPPCPLAPHHVANRVAGDDVVLRVLFATEPAAETCVRRLIEGALRAGELTGPDGLVMTWRVRSTAAGHVRESEKGHACELIGRC